jgi:hypothetical protein
MEGRDRILTRACRIVGHGCRASSTVTVGRRFGSQTKAACGEDNAKWLM